MIKSYIRKFNYQKKNEPIEAREVFIMVETDTALAGYDKKRIVDAEGNFDEAKWARIQEVFKNHDINPEMPTRGKKVDESTLSDIEKEIRSFNVGWRRFNKDRIVD